MARAPFHPGRDQIELPGLLDCLSDPTRLAIVYSLANFSEPELRCGDFNTFGGKSNLTYHFARLREAGVIQTRLEGTGRFMSLRRRDLDSRFPGLLDSILASVGRDAVRLDLPVCDLSACPSAAANTKKKR